MPLEDAILLINKDFQVVSGHQGPRPPAPVVKPTPTPEVDYELPEEVYYLLRAVLDNGSQFMSVTQLDVLIDYFQKSSSRKAISEPV